jgi:putative glutamine amidotransferase
MDGPAPTGADGAPRPVVAVTANRRVDDGVHWEVIRRKYLQALVARAGVEVCILPTDEAEAGVPGELGSIAPALLDRVDGLVLTGDESNLDPAWYAGRLPSGAPMPEGAADGRDRGRDGVSMRALAGALARGLPVLGICRGLHELNVFHGGTLWRHLPTDRPGLRHHEDLGLPRDDQYRPVHDVALAPDGVLATVFGAPSVAVSSLHFQGVRTLGAGLRVEATAPDGLVEAVSVADAPTFQVAVQWHPEWHADTDGPSAALFAGFGAACRARAAARVPA